MTTITSGFEAGSSGTTVSTSNSGGGGDTAFNFVSIGASATVAFDNTHAMHGSLSCKIATPATATTAYTQWSTAFTGYPFAQVWFRGYFYFTTAATANHKILTLQTGASATVSSVYWETSGKLVVTNAVGSAVLTSSTIPLNAWFRLEGFTVVSATVGQYSYSVWSTSPDGGGTADDTQTSAATQNTGGTNIENCDFGCQSSIASVGPYWMDDIGVSSTGPLGSSNPGTSAPAGLAAASGAVALAPAPSAAVNMTIQGV